MTAATFTDEERKLIQSAALRVWNEIASDIFLSVTDSGDVAENDVTIPREEVIELVLDADRTTEMLQRMKAPADLIARVKRAGSMVSVVSPAFRHTSYGL
jgi:Mg2+/Co2+ transporter CorB